MVAATAQSPGNTLSGADKCLDARSKVVCSPTTAVAETKAGSLVCALLRRVISSAHADLRVISNFISEKMRHVFF